MEQHTKEYFLSLLQGPIGVFAQERPSSYKLESQLGKTLKKLKLRYRGSYGIKKLPDLLPFSTISFSMQDHKLGQILEIKKIDISKVKTVIVQNMFEYEVWKEISSIHPIKIIGFKRGAACFFNYKIGEDTHPFFIVEEAIIPKNNILEWEGWSEQTEED